MNTVDRSIEPVGPPRLLDLIDALLAGQIDFPAFESEYYQAFLLWDDEDVEARILSWYAEVHEKLDWTTPQPSADERSYGWIDEKEFLAWLSEHRRAL